MPLVSGTLKTLKKRILIALNSEKGWGEPFSAYLLKQERDKERESEVRPL